jgi:O-antigen ligase
LLLIFDPAREPRTSAALWVPMVWMFIAASRNPSEWFAGWVGQSAQGLEEGNPLDRAIFGILIMIALGILISRSFKWGKFVTRNAALMAYILFALISICWSDFQFVALKRWVRDLGSYLVVLVVLTDPRPVAAMQMVLRRLGYVLVPLSILLNKYYPRLGRTFIDWSGEGYFKGVTTSKNMMGLMCLVLAMFYLWNIANSWRERRQPRVRRIIALDSAFLMGALWLLHLARSTTSSLCFVLGATVILAFHSKMFRRNPKWLRTLVPVSFCLYLILGFGLGMNGSLARAVGKDPTLTDRTKIWRFLLDMHTNPVIGTGYQSFWLGSRLQLFWQESGEGRLFEAHNGYLEVYLEEGLIGVVLLGGFLISGYKAIWRKKGPTPSSMTAFALAIWMVLVFYNMSEAAFDRGLLYTVFLLGAIRLPLRSDSRVPAPARFDVERRANQLQIPSMRSTSRSLGSRHELSDQPI